MPERRPPQRPMCRILHGPRANQVWPFVQFGNGGPVNLEINGKWQSFGKSEIELHPNLTQYPPTRGASHEDR